MNGNLLSLVEFSSTFFQMVVVSNAMRNVPVAGVYGWDPGAYFGFYSVDTFWIDPGARP